MLFATTPAISKPNRRFQSLRIYTNIRAPCTTRADNRAPEFDAFSIDENGTVIPERAPVPGPSKMEVIEYRYEYDRYGNWTEQSVVHRSESNEFSTVLNRKLTYY